MEARSVIDRREAAAPNRVADSVRRVGDFGAFSIKAIAALPGALRFTSEILRQAGLLITGSTLLVAGLTFVVGAECGLFGIYFLRPVGASDFVGLVTALCSGRLAPALIFGYIFAAKVGCGLVAEIGSMRIAEELDAFESVGVDPMRFVVATRLAAALLYMPFVYLIAVAATSLGGYLYVVVFLGEVSQGGFDVTHWALVSIPDLLLQFLEFLAIGTTIVLVATYYGFRVRGGAVEVGAATSRSMVANLVLVHVIIGALLTVLYGTTPDYPIGG